MFAVHELKIQKPHYDDVWCGNKRFECRLNDRDFKKGDVLHLREWQPERKAGNMIHQVECYTGNEVLVEVTHMLAYFVGLDKGYVIMSIELIKSRAMTEMIIRYKPDVNKEAEIILKQALIKHELMGAAVKDKYDKVYRVMCKKVEYVTFKNDVFTTHLHAGTYLVIHY